MPVLSKKRTIVAACACGVVVLSFLLLGRESARMRSLGEDEQLTQETLGGPLHRSSLGRGLSPVSSDDALPPLAWGENRPEYGRLLQDAPQITPHEPDDERFLELGQLLLWAIPFGLPGEDGRLTAECAAKYEPQLRGPCHWRTDYIIRRLGDRELAALEYLRVTPTGDNDDPACVAFASCTASVWSRQTDIPMPKTLGDVFAFHEFGRGARWRSSKGDRRHFYQQALSKAMEQLEYFNSLAQEDLQDDPVVRYNYEWTQRHVEEYQNLLAAIDEQEGAPVQ